MDELVKQLRFCAATDVSESPYPCDGCSYDNPNDYGLGDAWNVLGCSARMMFQAADAIEKLTGFAQEAERDRDEYRERLDKANDAIWFLQTYKVAFENIISMGGWWLVGQDKNLHRMNVPMNWPPKGTKTVEVFPLPTPPKEE